MTKRFSDRVTIGKLAESCGVSGDTIRFYERSGLLQTDTRSRAGYRLYDTESIRRLKFIKRTRDLGFSLDEILQILALRSADGATCGQMLELTQRKILDARTRVSELAHIERALTRLAETCPGGDTPIGQCTILDQLDPGDDLAGSSDEDTDHSSSRTCRTT